MFEVDIATYHESQELHDTVSDNGGVAVATYAPPKPTLTHEPRLPDQDVYEVRIFDGRRKRRLVAAIEIVSPSNKDQPDNRSVFVSKAATLLNLDEMPQLANAPLGLSILYLIRQAESQAPEMARDLVARAKTEIDDAALRADLIQLIETVVIYRLPRLSREEIQALLLVNDIRETRVYQEALEEGKKEEAARIILNMAAKNIPPEEIAALVKVDIEFVHQVLQGQRNG